MTQAQSLSELLSRVEAATGASRRLDAEIACTFIFRDLRPAEPGDHNNAYDGRVEGCIWVPTGFLQADRYSSSLDAALALVERVLPGVRVLMERESGYSAVELLSGRNKRERHLGGAERTDDELALALCLALLKALQAQPNPAGEQG